MKDPFKTHGAFSWNELMTSDPAAAKDFYQKLLGWDMEDMNMENMTYTVVKAGGDGRLSVDLLKRCLSSNKKELLTWKYIAKLIDEDE